MTEIIALLIGLNTVLWLAAVAILTVYIDRRIEERLGSADKRKTP